MDGTKDTAFLSAFHSFLCIRFFLSQILSLATDYGLVSQSLYFFFIFVFGRTTDVEGNPGSED
jgi:hypothetical protein